MKKILVASLVLTFIILISSSVYATIGNINLNTSSDSAIKGETFTVTIEASADNNITGLQCDLEYDINKLSIQKKSAGTGFSDLSGTGEIAIVSTDSDSLSKSGILYTITFKVLEESEIGETTISAKNAILAVLNDNSEQENINVGDNEAVVNIKVEGGTTDTPGEENPEDEIEKPANNVISNNVSIYKNTTEDDNKNTTKLPQTGIKSISIIAVTTLVGMSIISYIKYIKYKNI